MQYFEENKELKNNTQTIHINFNNREYKILTNDGIFSKDKLDYGSRLLLETIIKENIAGKVLDLGCGYGIIGLVIADNFPKSKVDMVDITDRAIALSQKNTHSLNNVKVFKSNIYDGITDKYDYIITNPPIRAGKEIIKEFLIGAKSHLTIDGKLYFVMRKNHGVKTMINILKEYYEVTIETRSKGFYIAKCALK